MTARQQANNDRDVIIPAGNPYHVVTSIKITNAMIKEPSNLSWLVSAKRNNAPPIRKKNTEKPVSKPYSNNPERIKAIYPKRKAKTRANRGILAP